jgi:hypothetical protein
LEFDQVKGVTADAPAPRVIDNSIVDQLPEEKFSKNFRQGTSLMGANFSLRILPIQTDK